MCRVKDEVSRPYKAIARQLEDPETFSVCVHIRLNDEAMLGQQRGDLEQQLQMYMDCVQVRRGFRTRFGRFLFSLKRVLDHVAENFALFIRRLYILCSVVIRRPGTVGANVHGVRTGEARNLDQVRTVYQ